MFEKKIFCSNLLHADLAETPNTYCIIVGTYLLYFK